MSVSHDQTEPSVAAGWYVDPHGVAGHRWWDGSRWTEHTHPEVARVAEPSTTSGYAQPGQGSGQAHQGVAESSYATSGAYQAYPAAGVQAGSGFAPASAAAPYQGAGAFGTSPFSAPAYPATGAGAAYPGAVTGYSTPSWSGYGDGQLTKPTNGLATGALVAGVLVIVVLLFLNYAIVSGIAVIVGVRAIMKARAIKAAGYPTAVGMARAVTGLVLSGIGALLYVLSMVAG